MKSLTEKYAAFARGLTIENIPFDVKGKVCDLILDTVGVGIAGSHSLPATIVRKWTKEEILAEEASIWGTREKSSIYGAALINGTASHAYDYDDTHNWSAIHISGVLVPCVLALGEKLKTTGHKILEAYVAGYEVTARIGVISNPKILYRKGFHGTGLAGPFGAALASGLIMGLTESQLVNALGIAGSFSSGLFQFIRDGAMTKRLHSGIAARHGMTAAALSRNGFTGPDAIIEGEKGYLNAFTGDLSKIDSAMKGLGEYFEIMDTHTKVYACVSGFSAPIECLIAIMDDHGIAPDQIESVDVGVREETYMCSRSPEENPKNILSAQMSLPYCLAAAAYYKDVKLAQFAEEKLKDSRIISLMHSIKIEASKELTELNEQDTVCLPGRVKVRTKEGEVFAHQLDYARDSRGNRASRAELQEKFLELCRPYIDDFRARKIMEMTYDLEALSDVSELVRLCQPA